MSGSAVLLILLLAPLPAGVDVLATYQGGQVTREEYDAWLLGQGLTDDPAARPARLEAMALADTLEAAAVAAGLDKRPQMAFRLAQIEPALLAAALRREVDRAIVITDEQVEEELKREDKHRFKPRTVQLRNIFKKVPPGATGPERAALRARMEAVRAQLLAGADFEQLSWRESDSQTRFRGGAMGYVPPGVLHPDVERVAFALKKGEVSAVLASADGFTILRCDDVDEGRVIPLDEARGMIRQGLWSRASLARQAELRADLLREAAPRDAGPAAGEGSPVVEFTGGRLTAAELGWLAGEPIDGLSAESRRQAIEAHAVQEAAAARARARGLDRDPALQAQARWQRATQLATDEMARRVNRSLVPPTEAEMRAHFDRNRERYTRQVHVDISIVEWPLGKTDVRARFAGAEALLARLRAGQISFEQAAREFSSHASASNGGRLGLLAMPVLAPLGPSVFRTVEDLAPGQTSGLVQQDAWVYVVKLWERQPTRPLTYSEAARRVEQELGDARVAALQKDLEAAARRDLKLETPPAPPPAP